jgi:two-component system cell cycle response regulator DivK
MTRNSAPAYTILVVEDYDDERELLRHYLDAYGYNVVEARDGEEAILAAEQSSPDLILMDIGLPERSGISATYKIRKKASNAQTPVIAITGYTDADLHQDAIDAGCREVLIKPLTLADIKRVLAEYLPD